MYYSYLEDLPGRLKRTIVHSVNVILEGGLEDIKSIRLFGSCARLSVNVRSDVDVVVETKNRLENARLIGVISSEADCNDDGVNVDVVFATTEDIEKSNKVLFKEIQRDGIVLWKGGEFTNEYNQLLGDSE